MYSFQPLKAVIWDMDGVLIDSLPAHVEAWRPILKRYGYDYTYEQMTPFFGMTDVNVLRTISSSRFTERELVSLAQEKECIYQDLIGTKLQLLPGVVAWLENFRSAGLKQAVASSSTVKSISIIMDALHLKSYFNAIVSGEGGPSKPDPLVFLRAAEQIGALPNECLVVEDAVVGVLAAKAASMHCLAVTTTTTAENLRQANLVVSRLDQLSVPALQAALSS